MLFVVLTVGDAKYALDARQVIEVVPLVTLRACVGAPASIAGLANYRGTSVPILDLGRLLGGAPCVLYLSTRIILLSHAGAHGVSRVIGLLAETVTNTVVREEADFCQQNLDAPETSCLGKLAVCGTGFIQRIEVSRLVPKALERLLFAEPEPAAS